MKGWEVREKIQTVTVEREQTLHQYKTIEAKIVGLKDELYQKTK